MVWGGRRHEWQLCFSGESVRLSGRRKVSVEGLKLVVPDNSEQLLQGKSVVLDAMNKVSQWCLSPLDWSPH